jgi:hypothetical protein
MAALGMAWFTQIGAHTGYLPQVHAYTTGFVVSAAVLALAATLIRASQEDL